MKTMVLQLLFIQLTYVHYGAQIQLDEHCSRTRLELQDVTESEPHFSVYSQLG